MTNRHSGSMRADLARVEPLLDQDISRRVSTLETKVTAEIQILETANTNNTDDIADFTERAEGLGIRPHPSPASAPQSPTLD